jgi:CcmD family protein
MTGLDHNAGYVLWAFAITWTVLGGYLLYIRSRLNGLRRRLARA